MDLTGSSLLSRRVIIGAGIALVAWVASSHAQKSRTRVGFVNRLQAEASLVFDGAIRKAAIGSAVFVDDEVRTGAGARLEVTFRDNSVVTVGANASLRIDTYVFDPDKKQAP